MLGSVFRASLLYTASGLASRGGLSLILLPLYAHVLSTSEYGAFEVVLLWGNLAYVSIALEISQGVARYYQDAPTAERESLVSTCFWFASLCYVAFAIGVHLTARWSSSWIFGGTSHSQTLQIAGWAIASGGVLQFAQVQMRIEIRPVAYSVCNLVWVAATIGSIVILLSSIGWALEGIFLGHLIGNLIGICACLWALQGSIGFQWDSSKLRSMLSFSLPLVPSSVGVIACLYLDRIWVKEMMSMTDVGIYSAAARVASVMGLVMSGLQASVTPLVMAHYQEPRTPEHLERLFRYFACGAFSIFILSSAFSGELIGAVAPSEYASAAKLIPLLVPAAAFWGMYIFAPGWLIGGKSGLFSLVNLGAAVLNALLNFLLIPSVGLLGAALSSLACAVISFVLLMAISQRSYPVPHRWGRLLLSAFLATAVAGTLSNATDVIVVVRVLAAASCAGLVGLLTARRAPATEGVG
jgi:O-antigen/teichoic acid export membrane protein